MTPAPLAILVGVLAAAALVGSGRRLPTALANALALAAAVAIGALCAVLLAHAWHGTHVTWLGGWHPRRGGVALGIDFAVDPLGAGAATFAAALVAIAFVYSQRYFDEVAPLYHALMLILLTGVVGICLTGDLFNLFVFFELMSVPAYALTAYDVEEAGPIQGALAFAIVNSIGSFLVVTGIGLVYGRTGALNLAQIGQALAGHRADGLVVAAFALIACGFLIKAAAVPFHLWLPDAYAVAPVPVCIIFAGIMVEIALFALARVYWTAFAGVPGMGGHGLGVVLAGVGALTAVVGSVMTLLQAHLKRLLAFSTIAHGGLLLVGLAVLDDHALGAASLFALTHGALNAALFMATGVVGLRLGTVAAGELHGRGRRVLSAAAVFLLGGAALASVPPLGPFMATASVEEAATAHGWWWAPALFCLCAALTGGAVLRAGARVFLGFGRPAGEDDAGTEHEADAEHAGRRRARTPVRMAAPMLALLVAGLAIGIAPAVRHGIDRAASVFTDRPAYAAQVLEHRGAVHPHGRPATGPHPSAYLYAALSVAGALAVVATAAAGGRRRAPAPVRAGRRVLEAWHDGHVGDYATWAVVGVAVVGWAVAVGVR